MVALRSTETIQMLQPPPKVENRRHQSLGELCAVVIGRSDRSVRYGLISHLRQNGRRVWIGFPIQEFRMTPETKSLVLDVPADLFEIAPGVDMEHLPECDGLSNEADPQVLDFISGHAPHLSSSRAASGNS